MKILLNKNKKIIFDNLIKNLNIQKKNKITNQILNINEILLKKKNFLIVFSLNQYEISFHPNLNDNFIKNYVLIIKKKYKNNFFFEQNKYIYYLLNKYIELLLNIINNKKIIKGRIIKKKKDKIFVLFLGKIISMQKKHLHNVKKMIYIKFKYNKLFKFYKLKLLNFKLLQINLKKKKFIFSRKLYVSDLKLQKKNATV